MINTSINYKTPDTQLPIVQITKEMVDASRCLAAYNVGEWCFVLNGRLLGYFSTREECEERVANLLAD
jgi:hypothetical protein